MDKNIIINHFKKKLKKKIISFMLSPIIIFSIVIVLIVASIGDMGTNTISVKVSAEENTAIADDLQEYLDKQVNVPNDDYLGICKKFALTKGNVMGYIKFIESREGKNIDEILSSQNKSEDDSEKSKDTNEKSEENKSKKDKDDEDSKGKINHNITKKVYPITSPFGMRSHPISGGTKFHTGIDIGVPMKTPIYALKDGKVTTAGNVSGYGTTVIIDHGNTSSLYAHNSSLKVSVGQKIKAGQLICYSGNSGNSTGPHLHFEVRNSNNQPINPTPYYSVGADTYSDNCNSENDSLSDIKRATHFYADKLKPKFTFAYLAKKDVVKIKAQHEFEKDTTDTSMETVKVVTHISSIYGEIDLEYETETKTYTDKDGEHTETIPKYKCYKLKNKLFDNLKNIIKKDYPKEEDLDMAISFVVNSSLNFDKQEYEGEWINKLPGEFIIDELINSAVDNGSMGSFAGTIPLYLQYDPAWANYPYEGATIRRGGCGVASLAMVVTGLEGKLGKWDKNKDNLLTPDEAADFSHAHGCDPPGCGTDGITLYPLVSKFGLRCRHYNKSNYNKVLEELKNGCPIIANVHGNGGAYGQPGNTFTRHGHFIVLTGVDPSGKIKVNDPANAENSKKLFDFKSIIVAESSDFWAFDNPNIKQNVFMATAYTGDNNPMEGGDGTAYLGAGSLRGKDLRNKYIAVDPKVIPLGSIVIIRFPAEARYWVMKDGTKVDANGAYVAVDTGGAIKGNRIDVYFGIGPYYLNLAQKFGRRNISVAIKKR